MMAEFSIVLEPIDLEQEYQKAAAAQADHTRRYGQCIQNGGLSYYQLGFKGTKEDIAYIESLQTKPYLQGRFHRRIFFDGSEPIGMIPNDPPPGKIIDSAEQTEAMGRLLATVSRRGISLFNCAILNTGETPTLDIY